MQFTADQLRAIAHYQNARALGVPNQGDGRNAVSYSGRDPYTGRTRVEVSNGGTANSKDIGNSSYVRGSVVATFSLRDRVGWVDRR